MTNLTRTHHGSSRLHVHVDLYRTISRACSLITSRTNGRRRSWGGIRKNRALLAKFLKFCIVLGMIMSI